MTIADPPRRSQRRVSSRPPTTNRHAAVLALVSGAGGFAAVTILRSAGLLNGFVMLFVLLGLLLMLPVAKTLSRRLLLTLPVLLGGVPLLWWVPWPAFFPDRGTLVLGAAAGAAAAAAAFRLAGGSVQRSLLPQVRGIDLVPLAAGLAAAFVQWNSLTVRRAEDALSLLSSRWDNASHFDMYFLIRREGQVIPLLPSAPDGSAWSFSDYPQGFHSLLATLAELVHGPSWRPMEAELVSYSILTGVVVVLSTLLVTAGVCSLPAFRRSALIGGPVAVVIACGWSLGPGTVAYMHGYANFFLAVSLAAAAVLLAVSMDRPAMVLPLMAATFAAVGIANNWMPLLAYLPGAIVMLCLPGRRSRWAAAKTQSIGAGMVIVLGLTGAAVAVYQLASVEVPDIVTAETSFPNFDAGVLWQLLALCAVAYILLLSRSRRQGLSASQQRAGWSVLALAGGAAATLAMSVIQLVELGTLSYYSMKLMLSLELMALVLAGVAVMHFVDAAGFGRPPAAAGQRGRRRKRPALYAASAAAMVAASQAFGGLVHVPDAGLAGTAPGVSEKLAQDSIRESGPSGSVLALLHAVSRNTGEPAMYLTTNTAQMDPVLAQQWYSALTQTYTEHNWELSWSMFALSEGESGLATAVNDILAEDPGTSIVVDPWNEEALAEALAGR